ncbi:hypothetical protein AAHA92_19159 [Salvia divinorum]|uniref:Uncharacterized protein n=1 Tax=Salvia divinorum TaxID=28513 RepID=A0ABD1H4F0_SALDI
MALSYQSKKAVMVGCRIRIPRMGLIVSDNFVIEGHGDGRPGALLRRTARWRIPVKDLYTYSATCYLKDRYCLYSSFERRFTAYMYV